MQNKLFDHYFTTWDLLRFPTTQQGQENEKIFNECDHGRRRRMTK